MKNKVTPQEINALMDSLEYKTLRVDGTTTTIVVAILPQNNYVLGFGSSACVDAANFDAELGEKIAKQNCYTKCLEKLWELEGYALAKELLNG